MSYNIVAQRVNARKHEMQAYRQYKGTTTVAPGRRFRGFHKVFAAALLCLTLTVSCRMATRPEGGEKRPSIGDGWPVLAASTSRDMGRQTLARLRDKISAANLADYREAGEIEAKFIEGDQARIDAVLERIASRMLNLIEQQDAYFKEQPDDWEEMDLAADFLFEQKHAEEALLLWERAVLIKPNSADLHNNIAVVCSHNGRILDAVDHPKNHLS